MTAPAGVFDVLNAACATNPNGTALVTRSGSLTYAEFDDLAGRAAGALFGLGVRPGDRIGAALPNDLDIVLAFHGAMRLGAVWVGINRLLAPPEKAYVVADSGARTVLGDEAALADLAGRVDADVCLVSAATWRTALEASASPPDVP
jgi:acyl-CoA synthetase (AMP-forming)/AMP-acid ligase II